MKLLEAQEAASEADRRPTDPSHPSHSIPGEKRPATAVERAPRKKKDELASSLPSPAAGDGIDEHSGKTFGGKYRIEKMIAKGGMGRVYRAIQFPLERPVAIKILNREFQATDPQFVRRFFLEASTAAKLAHPHTITVFDYGETETGELYIAMEYLKGRPLSKVISAEGPFDPHRALNISVQICRALREAHTFGIIHRDLKPGNVFLVEDGDEADYVKVLDFGLVKLFRPEKDGDKDDGGMLGEGDPELTRTGTLLGSPKYMSPEQIQGHALDPRTDIYSFGVILFQMMAGKAPYTGATGVDVIYKHVHLDIPAITDVAPQVECPIAVEAIIQKCLKKRREERYASMDELLLTLKEAIRMVSGQIVSPDSVAEPSSALALEARKLSKARASSQSKTVAPLSDSAKTVSPGTREAALREPQLSDEPTPMGQERSQVTRPPAVSNASRLLVLGSALGFLVLLGTLIFVLSSSRERKTAERVVEETAQPAKTQQTPARVETTVSFLSEPAGAQVFEAARPIGVTPFKKSFLVQSDAEEPRELVFRLAKYQDVVKTVILDGKLTEISVKLDPMPESPAVDEAAAESDSEPSGNKRRKNNSSTKSRKDKENTPAHYRQNPY